VQLRDYQETAITNLSASFRRGKRAPLLVLPTGGGKTFTAGTMCVRHLTRSPSNSVVWLAHRSELIDQAHGSLERLGADMARVSVTSVQTALRRDPPPATLVVQDECHHHVSDEWAKLNAMWPKAFRVGLTATPERGDGRGLGHAFDDIVVGATPAQLTELGILTPCRVVRPEKLLKTRRIAVEPVQAYLEHARGRQAIVFCQDIKHAQECLEGFRASGISAALVTGKTPWPERCATIAAFRAGAGQILVNVNVLTEGFDAPETSCCIIARGCGTTGLFIQMVGRAIRCAPGKTDAVLLDLRGVSHVHGDILDEREYSLDGKGISKKEAPTVSFCQVCGAVLVSGQDACPGCGRVRPPTPDVEVTNDRLWCADRAAMVPEATKIRDLVHWIRAARAKGHKPGRAYHLYKGRYFDWPTHRIRQLAEREARQ